MTTGSDTVRPRDESPRYRAVILLNTEDRPTRVIGIDGRKILLRCESSVTLEPRVRLRFDRLAKQKQPEIHAMLELKSALTEEDGNHVTLSFLALFSAGGRAPLERFLSDGMGINSQRDGRYSDRPRGTYFIFGSRADGKAPKASAEKAPRTRPSGPKRASTRVTVRVPVQFWCGESRRDGMAYNISDTGLYVATHEKTPAVGDSIEVQFPVKHPGRDITIDLCGRVCWSIPGMTSSRGGGFGVEIESVSDGEDGALWRAHVRDELDFGMQVSHA